jgi:hypothetical protein
MRRQLRQESSEPVGVHKYCTIGRHSCQSKSYYSYFDSDSHNALVLALTYDMAYQVKPYMNLGNRTSMRLTLTDSVVSFGSHP